MANQVAEFSAPTGTFPAMDSVAITPSDSVNIVGGFRAIYVGVAGNIVIVSFADVVTTFVGVLQGSILPVMGKRVNSTNTTASSLVALR